MNSQLEFEILNFKTDKSLVQELITEQTLKHNLQVYIKRDDLIHPHIMGNKWRKLKYNLLEFNKLNSNKLITFGGAHSNHILATAAAGKIFNIETIGIIRGEELTPDSNETLHVAHQLGMKLVFVTRNEYKLRYNTDYLKNLNNTYANSYIIPEGGCNELAIKGIEEMIQELPTTYDYYACSCGTGSTAAGIAKSISLNSKLIILPALNQIEEQKILVNSVHTHYNFEFITDYTFGGYAKSTQQLENFIQHYPIPLDKVYTGKLFYGIHQLIEQNYFKPHSKILVYHSGGYRLY